MRTVLMKSMFLAGQSCCSLAALHSMARSRLKCATVLVHKQPRAPESCHFWARLTFLDSSQPASRAGTAAQCAA